MTSRIFTGATYTCAVAATPEETLADEQRRRLPAAVAAIGAAILSLVGSIVAIAGDSEFPAVHVLSALGERLASNPPEPGLKARQVLYLNDHLFQQAGPLQQIGAAVITAVTVAAMAFALAYLYRATYARRPEVGRATIFVIVAGGVLVALPGIASGTALALEARSFADSSQQTAEAAREVFRSPVVISGVYLKEFGGLLLGLGFVLLSLKAMSVGLLTRFMGVLGIIVGVISILPLGRSLPFVQMLWLIALGMLFLHKWAGSQGLPPAWSSGEARPWPSQQELREARLARQEERTGSRGESKPAGRKQAAGRDEDAGRDEEAPASSNGKGRGRPSVPKTPAPKAPERPAHSSSKKKKRRRR